jgi:hypothetical protein
MEDSVTRSSPGARYFDFPQDQLWDKTSIMLCGKRVFSKRFIAQAVYTVCTRINYRIVPVTNLNKYLEYGTSGTE